MGEHFVKVVEDGTLAGGSGWVFGMPDDDGTIYFIAEQSAVTNQDVLNEAWTAAKQLVIEQAVRDGHVRYCDPEEN